MCLIMSLICFVHKKVSKWIDLVVIQALLVHIEKIFSFLHTFLETYKTFQYKLRKSQIYILLSSWSKLIFMEIEPARTSTYA